MLTLLVHRGPDDHGVIYNKLFTFGHRRLAIIDLHGGKQPCSDAHGNVLIFNGEIYGYQQLAQTLSQQHIHLRNNSDTEVLFCLLKHQGIEATLKMIDGMFAFAYYEHRTQQIYLARDRFGEKPLFYSIQNQQLVFASELKAIRQHPLLQQSTLDYKEISSYLTLEYLPGSMTGYQFINKLLPGHWLCFNPKEKSHNIHRYYQVRIHSSTSSKHTQEEKIAILRQHLVNSVKQRLIADVPVGVFLSGGLDSSLIAAIARQHSNQINSYTIKMPESSFDESPYAEECAKALDLQHTTIELSNTDVLAGFDRTIAKLDEPLADSSLLPSSLLCHFSRQHVKVAIGGDGADELFAGYPNFQAQQFAHLMQYIPASWGKLLRYSLQYLSVSDQYMNLAFRLRQLSYGFGLPIAQQSIYWMSAWFTEEQQRLWQPPYQSTINLELNKLLKNVQQESTNSHRINQLLYLFTTTYLADDILVKMDRASMYSSLEVRSPFLDKALTDYVFSLPRTDKIRFFQGKQLLKKLAHSYLPEKIIKRKKHGFGFPISNAIRTLFKERIADIILDRKNPLMDWFEPNQIEHYWQEHQAYRQDHGKKLWALYILMNIAKR